ncbi:MAG: ArsR family transcriptional regulator [Desulfobacteraceae bacterium]|nr:ArsR family transcriptional regulator [Desulfobacteraceae bacterium]
MFYGREPELGQLRELFGKPTASLVVCKGRRRIGKSTLIEQFGKGADHFYEFQGLAPAKNTTNESQLQNFSEQLGEQLGLPSLYLRNWNEAFSLLAKHTEHGKIVILLDEISWLASKDPEFVGKLKIAWDTKFKQNPKLILILCGSISSWIDHNILKDTDFVGRISLELNVQELPLDICNQFWGKAAQRISALEKLKVLSLTGGVPRYLEEIMPKQSAEQNIRRLCFKKGGMLITEFDKIFSDTFSGRAGMYAELVRLLAKGHKSFSDICAALGKEQSGVISEYLNDLETSGFIARDYIWRFDGKKSRLSHYRLKDNYVRFYLKYIEPNRDKIEKGLYSDIALERLPGWDTIMGFQFENLILHNLDIIRDTLHLDPNSIISASPHFQTKSTKNRGACQIDLLINTRFNTLYLCEIKFRRRLDKEVIDEVKKKIRVLQRPKYMSIRPVLIYAGEMSDAIEQAELFDQIIPFGDFLNEKLSS